MIRINQLKIAPGDFCEKKEDSIKKQVCKLLKLSPEQLQAVHFVKQSIDARKKPHIFYTLTVDVELQAGVKEEVILKHCRNNNVSLANTVMYQFPKAGPKKLTNRPVVIGAGPAGLFCAYLLAKHGYRPIVLERGEDVDSRMKTVEQFWKTGELKEQSNVQYGEGGAGTFSDGKLNTLVKDKWGRNREVLEIFIKAGASDKIGYENKPHLGTDMLVTIVKHMREEIITNGGEVHFCSEVTDFLIENNKIMGVEVNGTTHLETENVVLAIGHSARNTLETLYAKKIPMEAKAFAVGFRVEHPQTLINLSQYGMEEPKYLRPADYKLTAQTANGRGVYSFCMCPGGYVVNASSEQGRLAINGMSYSDRAGMHANSAIIVAVTPEDYGSTDALAGILFQRTLEEKAYLAGNGKIPVQYYGDFKENIASKEKTDKKPCMKGNYQFTNIRSILPEALNDSFIEGMEHFGRVIKDFDAEDVIVSGVESRTSSPVRIHRNENLQSSVEGLYPCGEGAGYAGGITSAAMDGMKVAEAIAQIYAPQ